MGDEEPHVIPDNVTKKSREKSVRYPSQSIKRCLDFLSIIHAIGGKKEAPIESILSKMNLTSPDTKSFKSIVSSSEIFGLIEKNDSGIKPSEIGTLILYPPDGEEEKKRLLIETFKAPQFYQKIIERYDNMILPNNNILKNVFLHLGIATKVLDTAVDAFIESAQYANVLDSNNRLNTNTNIEKTSPSPINPVENLLATPPKSAEQTEQSQQPSTIEAPRKSNVDFYKLEIPTSSGKMASITLPKDAIKEDIELIIGLLKVVQVKSGASSDE